MSVDLYDIQCSGNGKSKTLSKTLFALQQILWTVIDSDWENVFLDKP